MAAAIRPSLRRVSAEVAQRRVAVAPGRHRLTNPAVASSPRRYEQYDQGEGEGEEDGAEGDSNVAEETEELSDEELARRLQEVRLAWCFSMMGPECECRQHSGQAGTGPTHARMLA